MIDYTNFGASTMGTPSPVGGGDIRKRRPAAQQPLGATIAQQGGSGQPAATQVPPRAPQAAGMPGQAVQAAPTQSPTFAQLQAQGIPRPAPPAPAAMLSPAGLQPPAPTPVGYPTGGGIQQGTTIGQIQNGTGAGAPTTPTPTSYPTSTGVQGDNSLGSQIEAILKQLLSSPTAYGTDAMNREYESGARKIDDDYALRQKSLNEEMARRGLYDSSIAGGNLSDLNIGRRSAQEDLMDSLLQKRADYQDNAMRSALQLAMGRDTDMNQWLQAWYQLFGGTQ